MRRERRLRRRKVLWEEALLRQGFGGQAGGVCPPEADCGTKARAEEGAISGLKARNAGQGGRSKLLPNEKAAGTGWPGGSRKGMPVGQPGQDRWQACGDMGALESKENVRDEERP
ncbi:MAG: hypothetical protein JSV79_02530 [Armatimonadota bacterium]|nr:MAG: hypothetical protein JSV79_02530 [Armatimonadota bacterium]